MAPIPPVNPIPASETNSNDIAPPANPFASYFGATQNGGDEAFPVSNPVLPADPVPVPIAQPVPVPVEPVAPSLVPPTTDFKQILSDEIQNVLDTNLAEVNDAEVVEKSQSLELQSRVKELEQQVSNQKSMLHQYEAQILSTVKIILFINS